MIKVTGDGWEVPSISCSTQKLAEAVYKIFSSYVGEEIKSDILVNNNRHKEYPLAHFEKNNGNWEITLCCESGNHWAQMAYQLSHELCHLYCNHSLARKHKHKWFEESLCECASIAVMYKLGEDWNFFEISSYNSSYGSHITEYIGQVVNTVHRLFDTSNEFTSWLSSMLPQLEKSSTQREINKVVAIYLFNSILKEQSDNWSAIISLNLWDCSMDRNFYSFIDNWLFASESNFEEVKKITTLLGDS
ncbi:hypothetical protein LF935_06780 [Pectobacterium carotovorum]|uniref:hypothetical protein n=1 Tax=Pectobacterium carotovorum TaxID=554 RepID=UPI001CF3BB2B|nr:hypothetical protein [Pectobacterium carotovorum]MCA6969336.1 hypothetical protein [Pectobacterium carotovorum]